MSRATTLNVYTPSTTLRHPGKGRGGAEVADNLRLAWAENVRPALVRHTELVIVGAVAGRWANHHRRAGHWRPRRLQARHARRRA